MAAPGPSFIVALRGIAMATEAEWHKVLTTPASVLPPLTTDEARRADAAGIDAAAFASSLYLNRLAQDRLNAQGRALGKEVEGILASLDASFRVLQLVWEPANRPGGPQFWLARIALGRDSIVEVEIDPELAQAVMDQLAPGLDELAIRVRSVVRKRSVGVTGGAA